MSILTDTDFEKVVGTYLRDHPEISALDARIASAIPTNFTRPWIKLNQLDASNVTNAQPEHVIEYYLQFDCYAGSGDANAREAASAIARTVRSVLKQAEGDMIDNVVVTQVTFTSHTRLPDTAFDPARERYVLDALLRCHV